MKKESNIQKSILLAAGPTGCRLFRINAGSGWTGKVTYNKDGSITIHNPRPFHGATTGYADLTGFTPVVITPELVGQTLAVFTAIECKSPTGKPTPEQINFIEQIRKAGGRAGIARSADEALKIIQNL